MKLSSVLIDMLRQNGRAILDAIVAAEDDPQALAARASSRAKASKDFLAEAVRGRLRDHHRFMIRSSALHPRLIDVTREEVEEIDRRIGGHPNSFRGAVDLQKSMSGISDIAAHVILGGQPVSGPAQFGAGGR